MNSHRVSTLLVFWVIAAGMLVTSAAHSQYIADTGRTERKQPIVSGAPSPHATTSTATTRPTAGTLLDPALERAITESDLGKIAVQSEGVEVTLRTFANVQVNGITGRSRFERHDPLFTILSMIYRQREWAQVSMIPVENPQLAQTFGLDPEKHHRVSPNWVMNTPAVHTMVLAENSPQEQALSKDARDALKKFRFRVFSFFALPEEFRILPVANASTWATPWDLQSPGNVDDPQLATALKAADLSSQPYAAAIALDHALRQAIGQSHAQHLESSVASFLGVAEGVSGYMSASRRWLDYFNTTVHPFQKSAWIYLVAFLMFAAYLRTTKPSSPAAQEEDNKPPHAKDEPLADGDDFSDVLRPLGGPGTATALAEPKVAARSSAAVDPASHAAMHRTPGSRGLWAASYAMFGIGTLTVIGALVSRFILAQRMPVSNLYESIVFSLGAFAILALVFEGIYRRGWVGVSAAVSGFILMSLANSLPLRMRKVEPLVAVLNSVWLNWHVTALLISYSCFLLSFVFSLLFLYKEARGNRHGLLPGKEMFEYLNYRSVQVGWPLLTLGIFLGAVWANTAWGSYWSWDPKETWALITWFAYTIYLHLRMNVGWHGRKSIYAALFGFAMVLVTYFGVNYLPMLSGGLHSYAEPIAR